MRTLSEYSSRKSSMWSSSSVSGVNPLRCSRVERSWSLVELSSVRSRSRTRISFLARLRVAMSDALAMLVAAAKAGSTKASSMFATVAPKALPPASSSVAPHR
jgi:hypothetical protein